ncbi:MAG: HAD family hydrolase [Eubacteriaceae bacterium]|nr:HAD family hydrolase [Eubacteriaceae bacterium]
MDEKLQGAIFELDGALLDTIDGVTQALNLLLAEEGLAETSVSAVRAIIGQGPNEELKLALPNLPEGEAAKKLFSYNLHYSSVMMQKTKPYEGIVDLLRQLNAKQIPIAVVTTKKNEYAQMLINYFYPDIFFYSVIGAQDGVPGMPDPTSAKFALQMMHIKTGEALFAASSPIGAQTGKSAGILTAGTAWGYSSSKELKAAGAGIILKKPLDALKYF